MPAPAKDTCFGGSEMDWIAQYFLPSARGFRLLPVPKCFYGSTEDILADHQLPLDREKKARAEMDGGK